MMWKADLGLLLRTLRQGLKEILSKHIWLPEIAAGFCPSCRSRMHKNAGDFQNPKYSVIDGESERDRGVERGRDADPFISPHSWQSDLNGNY